MARLAGVLLVVVGTAGSAGATDHIDSGGPAVPRRADLSDLFAWTVAPGRLAIAVMARPYSAAGARFDPDVTHRVVLRGAVITGTADAVEIAAGDEARIECSVRPGRPGSEDRMACDAVSATGHHVVEARIGDERAGAPADALRLFAGVRRDPFFINVGVVHDLRARGGDRVPSRGPDFITPGFVRGKVQAVVLEVDVAALFGAAPGLVLVAAETDIDGVHMDRVGRPEITGFVLKRRWGEEIPGEDVRDNWNAETTFALTPGHLPYYEAAMGAGLARLDDLDRFPDPSVRGRIRAVPGQPDWPVPHPLARLLLLDALLVDPDRVCTLETNSYLEIEMASYRGLPPAADGDRHQTCGGRTPNTDVVDETLTLFVNGPDRVPPGPPLYGPLDAYAPRRGDGIDRPRTPAGGDFPYLQAP